MVNDPRDDHGAALLMIANQNREIADLRAEREMVVASWKREELDWEATEKALRARVAELESAALAVLGCNDRCCIQSPQCPAQCQADEKLRRLVQSAGAVPE